MRAGTRVPADPVFVEDLIDPSILAGQSVLGDDVESAAVRGSGSLLLSLLAVCASVCSVVTAFW